MLPSIRQHAYRTWFLRRLDRRCSPACHDGGTRRDGNGGRRPDTGLKRMEFHSNAGETTVLLKGLHQDVARPVAGSCSTRLRSSESVRIDSAKSHHHEPSVTQM